MLKPTSTYKMSKSLKASLALSKLQDPHKKGQWKRAMIDAELSAQIKHKEKKKGQPDLED
jgi:cysteinyl-tRNA synthetase